jgi:hypothetical protein
MTSRAAILNQRLASVQEAINATLARGVDGYTTGEGQSITSMKLRDLRIEEQAIINELARINRGTRFGRVGFARAQ